MTSYVASITPLTTGPKERRRIQVTGTVQGVGFRPFVYRRARAHGLAGFARNGPEGVIIEAEGSGAAVAAFIREVQDEAPPHAVVRAIHITQLPVRNETRFRIEASAEAGRPETPVLPDLATCEACWEELFDPTNRRYRYPFTNCTNCGPRYSIIRDLPYDRSRTTMDRFPLCSACEGEYTDPGDRRFHAEPNACPHCGPQLTFWERAEGENLVFRHAALEAAAEAIRRGQIMAVKGLGGFHLMADARDSRAIDRLRHRKGRAAKPLAVMVPDLPVARALCPISEAEEGLLTGWEHPIVLLRRRSESMLAPEVAPDNPYLGIMLPYTPLHHLLMADLGFPVVATSGNLSEEPIATDDVEASRRLGLVADGFLGHNRPIARPVDDSVARVIAGHPQLLRRARGYAPAPLDGPELSPGVLALGGHLKAAAALTQTGSVVLGQPIGDLDSPLGRDAHETVTDSLLRLYRARPRVIACDLHPDYATTRQAEERAAEEGLPIVRIQHHLAHVVSGMAEKGLDPPVLGVAWDGTGYGPDGAIWGGEFLCVTREGWYRAGHLRSFRLPGGTAAIREPRRSALGLLYEVFGEEGLGMDQLVPVASFSNAERRILAALLAGGGNAPLTTSAGRFFDGLSALLGLCQYASYEGQASCALEWATTDLAEEETRYTFPISSPEEGAAGWILDWVPALRALLADWEAGVPVAIIAARLHAGLASAIVEAAARIGNETILLTGGCFQNAELTERALSQLRCTGHQVFWHQEVPPGDGGLALGQAVWTARLMARGELPCA